MTRIALIKNGVVEVVLATEADMAVPSETANVGDVYDPATGSFSLIAPQPVE